MLIIFDTSKSIVKRFGHRRTQCCTIIGAQQKNIDLSTGYLLSVITNVGTKVVSVELNKQLNTTH